MLKNLIYSLTIAFSFLLLTVSTFNITYAYLDNNEVFNEIYTITNMGESFIIICAVTLALLVSSLIIYIKEKTV